MQFAEFSVYFALFQIRLQNIVFTAAPDMKWRQAALNHQQFH